MIRKIVGINEDLCNGCGSCTNACHEHAIVMVNNKAKLVKDDYCDGFGDCLPACPTNAITIIEREAAAYDEEAVKKRIEEAKKSINIENRTVHMCPGTMAKSLIKEDKSSQGENNIKVQSRLMQWPVQIKLVPVKAPYFNNCDLLIAADCTAYAYGNFHEEFIKGRITLIGCPKLDEGDYSEKLTAIMESNNIKSVKIARMEVPCCGGLENAALKAIRNSRKDIPYEVVTISSNGEVV